MVRGVISVEPVTALSQGSPVAESEIDPGSWPSHPDDVQPLYETPFPRREGDPPAPEEPPEASLVVVRGVKGQHEGGRPLLMLFRRQGGYWFRDGSNLPPYGWGRLVEWDENRSPVQVAPVVAEEEDPDA